MKYRISAFFSVLLFFLSLCGCTIQTEEPQNGLRIVTTIYPPYDFAKQITGDAADIHILLKPGTDGHDYEPTPSDLKAIRSCDLFLYIGGESEQWVTDLLQSSDTEICAIALLDVAEPLEDTDHDHEHMQDEHIWTSPKNAILMVEIIRDALCKIDPASKDRYCSNAEQYCKKLQELDKAFATAVSEAKRTEIVFAGRNPFRYLARDYGLTCHAAFEGCSNETDPSPATLTKLIQTVQDQNIPVIFYLEFASMQIPELLAKETGTTLLQLHSAHTVSADDLKHGVTYLELMTQNLENLKQAIS